MVRANDRGRQQVDALAHSPSSRFFFALECILSSELLHEGDCAFLLKVVRLLRRDGWRYAEVADERDPANAMADRMTSTTNLLSLGKIGLLVSIM